MEVIITKGYIKDLSKLPKPIIIAADKIIDKLHKAKSLEESGVDYKKLEGGKNEQYYRIRVGDWRMGIEYKHPKLIIITILHRGSVYKKFP